MTSAIHVVTSPTADTPGTTFILQTQKQHYVFGSHAEGTQRAMSQMGTKLAKAQDFFMTGRMDWSNAGGLIGMALTLADSASSSYDNAMQVFSKNSKKSGEPAPPKLNVYGPPNLKHALATCRRFIFRKGVPIVATEYKDEAPQKNEAGAIVPTWQDSTIQVWAMCIAPTPKDTEARVDRDLDSQRSQYDQFANNFEEHRAPENESPEEREARYDRIRSAVLGHMFNSNWSFDTLVERHISEVEMPTAMFVRNPNTHRVEPYRGPKPGGQEPLPDIKVLTRTPWPGAVVVSLPPTAPAAESISYIVRSRSTRGTFDPKRAKELGLRPGPLYGALGRGESVRNAKGETITPDMVIGPDKEGQGFAILDVPSVDYLQTLIQREEFGADNIMRGVKVFFWTLGPGVSGDPMLQQFMQRFGQVEHIISSVDDCPNRITFDSVAAQTTRLSLIDPARYHIPQHDSKALPQKSWYGIGSPGRVNILQNASSADRGLAYNLMPKFGKLDVVIPEVNLAEVKEQMDEEVLRLAEVARQELEKDQNALSDWRQLLARPDTEVITLGTGSALPSKYRNVSATLIRVPGVGNYLFDCGEGTLGQLQRIFTPEELVDVIKDLRMIWISHLHADHHLGTASVIRAWYKIKHNNVPRKHNLPLSAITADSASTFGLSVVSHEGMLKWLWEYSFVEDYGYSRILRFEILPVANGCDSGSKLSLVNNSVTGRIDQQRVVLQQKDYESLFGLSDIQACRVSHCHGALAVSLTFPRASTDPEDVPPLKVSYSGDCRPAKYFTLIGRDTTVLIHEATFDDELQADAIAKKHSTTSEALGIGTQMDAKAVVLTHFSQRYQKIPVLQTVQDGEQEDNLLNLNAIEDVKQEDDATDEAAPIDNVDASASTSALPSDSARPPSLAKGGSTSQHEQVIKVRSKDMKVAIAFDYMRVKIGEIAQLEKFNEALNRLLATEEEAEEAPKDDEKVVMNENGKKASGDEEGGGKKKKSKRNN